MKEDSKLLLLIIPFLAVPRLLTHTWDDNAITFALSLVERAALLWFTWFVARRTMIRLGAPLAASAISLLRLEAWGLALWTGQLTLLMSGTPTAMNVVAAILILLVCYRCYFMFMPLVLGAPFAEALPEAASIVKSRPFAPIVIEMIGASFGLLPHALMMLPYPDGRFPLLSYGAEALNILPWVITTYLALGWGLAVEENRPRRFGPYLNERLVTASVRAPTILSRCLSISGGMQLLGLALLVWLGNYVRLLETPPTASIKVERAAARGKKVFVEIRAIDYDYRFRAFEPVQFALAGEKRTVIAPFPESVHVDGNITSPRERIPDRTEARLTLQFATERSPEELATLKDVYLWYRGVKIAHLSIEAAADTGQNEPK